MQDVVEARYLSGHVVWLRFEDGTEGEVDLSSELEGPVFEPLKDPVCFARVALNPDTGTIEWPNRADFAPEFLYERVHAWAPIKNGRLSWAKLSTPVVHRVGPGQKTRAGLTPACDDHKIVTMNRKREVAAGDFKARCLALLEEVAQTGQEIVVTKRGRPVAKVVPVQAPRSLRGSVVYEGDIITPLDDEWESNG